MPGPSVAPPSEVSIGSAPGEVETRRDVRVLVAVTAAAALAVMAATAPAAWGRALELPVALWAFAGAMAAGILLLQTRTFILRWRGHSVAATLDEGFVFLMLVVLPPVLAPWLMIVPVWLVQVVRGRHFVKGAYNVSTHLVGAAVGAGAFAGLSAWADPLLAAVLGTAAYTIVSNLLVSAVFARMEGTTPWHVFRERFVATTFLLVSLGCSAGVILLALWSYHPVALLAAAPFLFLAREYASFRVRSERVLMAHDRIARMTKVLAGTRRHEDLVEEVLRAAGDLLPTSRASLMLLTRHGLRGNTWTRTFPRSPRRWDKLDAPLLAADGSVLGAITLDLEADPRNDDSDLGPALLRLVASEASAALERLEQQDVRAKAY